jgi:hypothetical protein
LLIQSLLPLYQEYAFYLGKDLGVAKVLLLGGAAGAGGDTRPATLAQSVIDF